MTRKIQYFIDPQDTIGHYYHVRMIWEPEQDIQSVELVMPAWTPGSYMIRDYARLVHGFSANCAWEQTGLSNWKIFPYHKKGEVITDITNDTKSQEERQIIIEYKVYAFEDLSVRTNHLEDDFGLINSPGLFFYVKEWNNVSISISFELGKPFSFIHSTLERVSEFQFISKSWDELFDSPFFLNHKKALEFTSRNTKHELVIEGNIFQKFQNELLKDLKAITDFEIDMMGGSPNKEYLFVLILSDGKYGGLEHTSCSINLFDQSKVNSEKEYKKLLELLAHEYFHLWNVKRIRPLALGPFDYEYPNLTKELWIAEGITSFYDAYFLLKTKLLTPEQYLEKIYEDILNLEDNLGDEIMSLEESSLTAWNKLYKRTTDSPNTSISYYTKGAVLVLCMNLRILEKTRGEKDFSLIMNGLYKEYYLGKKRGFTKDEFFDLAERETGCNLKEEFDIYISQATRIPVGDYLEILGIERLNENEIVDTGFLCRESKGSLYVQKIFRGRIDPMANIYLDDEIIAIEGERVRNKSQWNEILTSLSPNESVKLHIIRNNRIKEIEIVLGKRWETRKLVFREEQTTATNSKSISEEIGILREKFF